ncbi:MAG: transcription antitermination factor NusB [Holosporaceae bacterium]
MSDQTNDAANARRLHLKKRSASRLMAVQALYQAVLQEEPLHKVCADFTQEPMVSWLRSESIVGDADYFRELLQPFIAQDLSLFDTKIQGLLTPQWHFERLEPLLLALLRVASSELFVKKEVPQALIINEYVTLTHGFFSQKEPALVHAVLDKMALQLRS